MPDRQINSSILREYDIRGIVGETLLVDDAVTLGRAFGTLIRRNGGIAQSPLWRCGTRVPAAEAAFANALAASALDYDSLHENVHPDAIVLADGFSCQTQLTSLADRPSMSLAELLATH